MSVPADRSEPNAVLASRRELCDGLSIVRVAYRDGRVLPFEPGQFVSLGLPEPGAGQRIAERAYSIASRPGDAELEFFLRRVDDGSLSPRLFALAPGDPLWMDTRALGHFTLADVPSHSDLVMIATGTGLAPFIAMLRAFSGADRWRSVALVHGARAEAELGYGAELEELARADPRVRYLPILSRETGAGWRGPRGRVQDLLAEEAWRERALPPLDPEHAQVLLCGNPAMIAEVTALLEARGLRRHRRSAPGNVRSERYW